MTGNCAAISLVLSLSAKLEERRLKEFDLRMNEYSFIIVDWKCLNLNTGDEAVRR